ADVFTSLHDFQLASDVTVEGAAEDGQLRVTFTSFAAHARDRYDWDPTKHLKVPNPDFERKAPDAVEPTASTIEVYHSNARRVEGAGLAAPYDFVTEGWKVTDPAVVGPALIDPKRKL